MKRPFSYQSNTTASCSFLSGHRGLCQTEVTWNLPQTPFLIWKEANSCKQLEEQEAAWKRHWTRVISFLQLTFCLIGRSHGKTLGQWSHGYPKPQKFPKSLPAKGHSGLSQPWLPSTKSQTASLVSLKRLLGESYWKSILKKKERKRNSRQKEETPLPPTQLGRNNSFLCSDNEIQTRSTGQRGLHKSSTALALAQGQLSSCAGVKRNKGLFTDFCCLKMGQQLMNSDLGG